MHGLSCQLGLTASLSLAERVALKASALLNRPYTIMMQDLCLPNFHPDERKTESGISKQKEMLPIMGMANRETNENELFELMAKKLNIDKENILDYELSLSGRQKMLIS